MPQRTAVLPGAAAQEEERCETNKRWQAARKLTEESRERAHQAAEQIRRVERGAAVVHNRKLWERGQKLSQLKRRHRHRSRHQRNNSAVQIDPLRSAAANFDWPRQPGPNARYIMDGSMIQEEVHQDGLIRGV